MNKEEAINILYGMRADNLNLDDLHTKDKYDALTMAIKALEDKGRDRKKAKRFKNKYLKLKTAIGKIKKEIIQVVAEESTEDLKWASGLKYSIKIIDKVLDRKGE